MAKDWENRPFRFSKSAIQLFQQCPEKFSYVYIHHLPDMGGPESMLGQKIHQVFFEFYSMMNVNEIKTEEDLVKYAEKYKDGRISDHLAHFLSFNLQIFRSLRNKHLIKPLMAEQKMYCPELNLSGLVDVVFADDDDNVLVMDYKTGKYNPAKLPEYRMELSVYAELIKRMTSYTPTHWGIKFSKPGVVWIEPIQPKYFETTVIPVMEDMKKAMEKKEYPPKTGPLCMYCPMKSRCSAFGGAKDRRLKKLEKV